MMTYKDHVALVRLQIAAAMKYTLSGKWGEAPGKESLEEVERAARATANFADALATLDEIATKLGVLDDVGGFSIATAAEAAGLDRDE